MAGTKCLEVPATRVTVDILMHRLWIALCGLFALTPGITVAASPGFVRDCRPCTFAIAPDITYTFTFEWEHTKNGRSVTQIVARRAAEAGETQTLLVPKMAPIPEDEEVFFTTQDINFDGYQDLLLLTGRGVANSYGEYWLFDLPHATYTALGKYPMFSVDAERQRLTTYERGGHGGMIYEARDYAFRAGTLTLIHSEKQTWVPQRQRYYRVERALTNGKLIVVRRQWIKPP